MNDFKIEEIGKEITDKVSDINIKILYEIIKASDPDILKNITDHCYGTVGIAENEVAIILRTILANYFGFYTVKFAEEHETKLKASLKEIQDELDAVIKRVGRMK
jgi:hypothetical protein